MIDSVKKGFWHIFNKDFLRSSYFFSFPYPSFDFGRKKILENLQLSQGVNYQVEKYSMKGNYQTVHVLTIDATKNHIKIDLNIPDPINKLETVESQVKKNINIGQKVLAAINASFFETKGLVQGFPANFLMKDRKLINFGRTSKSFNGFNFKKQAFAIQNDGLGFIGDYSPDVRVNMKGIEIPIFYIDDLKRRDGQAALFTPRHHLPKVSDSSTNKSIELVVELLQPQPCDVYLRIGSMVKGIITKRNTYGDYVNSDIPANGFVIVAHGKKWAEKLSNIQVGDKISLTFDMDSKWKLADFIIGAGPFLVKDGKRHITMNPYSLHAMTRTARTAVGIKDNGKTIFFVTVDGRNKNHSEGFTITELADYFIFQLKASHAINLDGGRSSTMLVKKPNALLPTLVNHPMGQKQREVSTSLQILEVAE